MTTRWPEIQAMLNGEFWEPIGLFTVQGTAAPPDLGYQADLARALDFIAEGLYEWIAVNYPAAVFPMRPSGLTGVANLVAALKAWHRPGRKFVLTGYSQGANVVCIVWRDFILNPDGELHYMLDDVLAVITWGNPMRAPGIAWGNKLAGLPIPPKQNGAVTGGIAGPEVLRPEECLHPVTGGPIVIDYANDNDLYTDAPVGKEPWDEQTDVGHTEYLIYDAIQDFNGKDLWAFAKYAFKFLTPDIKEVWTLVQAIWNGLRFLTAGPRAPHWTYDVGPAVRYLLELANEPSAADRGTAAITKVGLE